MYEDDNVYFGAQILLSFTGMILGIAMIWVGSKTDCRIHNLTLFLIIAGANNCICSVLKLIQLAVNRFRKKNLSPMTKFWCINLRLSAWTLADFVLTVWGTVILSMHYHAWSWDDPTSESFCQREAMGLLFFFVVFSWCLPVMLCCCCCCITCCYVCLCIRKPEKQNKSVHSDSQV
jgi:hypothetical protein